MNNFKCYLLKCISIGTIISCIIVAGVSVFAEPEDEDNSDYNTESTIIDVSDISNISSEYIDDTSSEYIDEPISELESSQDESSQINSEPEQSYYSPESQNYSNAPQSEIEFSSSQDESSKTLIDTKSEIDTSEMTPDDWHFDYNKDSVTSQKTDFSDIKNSQVVQETQKDDSQWILYLGIALIAIALSAIGFITVKYIMFKKNNSEIKVQPSDSNKLKNAKKLPDNKNSKNKGKRKK